jgi:hypothetical protein
MHDMHLPCSTAKLTNFELKIRHQQLSGCLPVHLTVCPFVCSLFVWLSVHLSACVSIFLSVRLTVYMSICLSVHMSVCPSDCLFIWLSVHLTVCPSDCLPIWLSTNQTVCSSDCLSICLSLCPFVCVSNCLSVFPFVRTKFLQAYSGKKNLWAKFLSTNIVTYQFFTTNVRPFLEQMHLNINH